MSCLDYAIRGDCCLCYESVTDETPGYLRDAITEVETRSGTHYVCDDCLSDLRRKYEEGEIDVLDVNS